MHMAVLKFSYPLRLFNCSCKCHFAAQGRGGYMKIRFANNSALNNVDLFSFNRKLQCDVWSLALAWRVSQCLKGWWCCASTCLKLPPLDATWPQALSKVSRCEIQAFPGAAHVPWVSACFSHVPPKSRFSDVNIDLPRLRFFSSRGLQDINGCQWMSMYATFVLAAYNLCHFPNPEGVLTLYLNHAAQSRAQSP